MWQAFSNRLAYCCYKSDLSDRGIHVHLGLGSEHTIFKLSNAKSNFHFHSSHKARLFPAPPDIQGTFFIQYYHDIWPHAAGVSLESGQPRHAMHMWRYMTSRDTAGLILRYITMTFSLLPDDAGCISVADGHGRYGVYIIMAIRCIMQWLEINQMRKLHFSRRALLYCVKWRHFQY